MIRRRAAFMLVALLSAFMASVPSAAPASALSLSPTNWRSTIDSISPGTDLISIELFAGGEAIRVTALPGHEVIVPGYSREPYLRIAADGTTSINLLSPAIAMNATSTGSGATATGDARAEPRWQQLDQRGWVQWHDHRIHEMPGVSSPLSWNLPIVVDGQVIAVNGTLVQEPVHGRLVRLLFSFAIAVLGVGVALLPAWRRPDAHAATIGVLIGSLLALWSSTLVWLRTPTGFDHPIPLVALSGIALLAALSALQPSYARLVATLVSVAALCGWVAIQWNVLTSTQVPASDLVNPRALLVPFVAGIALGAAVLAVRGAGAPQADAAPAPR